MRAHVHLCTHSALASASWSAFFRGRPLSGGRHLLDLDVVPGSNLADLVRCWRSLQSPGFKAQGQRGCKLSRFLPGLAEFGIPAKSTLNFLTQSIAFMATWELGFADPSRVNDVSVSCFVEIPPEHKFDKRFSSCTVMLLRWLRALFRLLQKTPLLP